MDLGLDKKKAIVAAATSGLGFGTAMALSEAGCTVAICGRDEDRLAEAAKQIPNSIPIQADLATAEQAAGFVDKAIDRLEGLDILVTNSGGPAAGTFESTPIGEYSKGLEMILTAAASMCHQALPAMKQQRWGRIVAVTSMTVREPNPNIVLSNTARTGLTSLLKTLSREVAADGITVNTVQPGLHETPRLKELYGDKLQQVVDSAIPQGVVGQASDFGQVVAFLCSEQAKYITGASIPVDGGSFSGLQ